MANQTGELNGEALRLDFDRRLMLQFRGSVVTSDAELLPYWIIADLKELSARDDQRSSIAKEGVA